MKKVKTIKAEGWLKKRSPRWYVRVANLARDGLSDTSIAKAIHVTPWTFSKMVKKDEELRLILAEAREKVDFVDYVFGRLPPKLKAYWQRVVDFEKGKKRNRKSRQVGDLTDDLKELSIMSQQKLFLYALVESNFMVKDACRRLDITSRVYDNWIMYYPAFRKLIENMHEAKKDFFESALMKLVKKGDTAAIIFANRTLNRDRGYHEKITIENNTTITHRIDSDVVLAALSISARRELLQVLRDQQTPQLEDKSGPPNH